AVEENSSDHGRGLPAAANPGVSETRFCRRSKNARVENARTLPAPRALFVLHASHARMLAPVCPTTIGRNGTFLAYPVAVRRRDRAATALGGGVRFGLGLGGRMG